MEVEGEPDRFIVGSGHHRLGMRRVAEERFMDQLLGCHDGVQEPLVLGQLPDEGQDQRDVGGRGRVDPERCVRLAHMVGILRWTGRSERLFDVGDEVLGRFDADREPHEVVRDGGAGPFRNPALLGEALRAAASGLASLAPACVPGEWRSAEVSALEPEWRLNDCSRDCILIH